MSPADCEIRLAQTRARGALRNARSTLAGALDKLDGYIERYEQADALTKKADVLNWTISHLATYIAGNVRLDLIADAQAALMRTDALQ
jgi:hypothetical protein